MDETLDFAKSRLNWSNSFQVGTLNVTLAEIRTILGPQMTVERSTRMAEVVAQRSLHLIPVLENIYDHGNISAVMRSAEAFGFLQMYKIAAPGGRFKVANRVTRGADKWLDVRSFSESGVAVAELKARGYQVWATDLNTPHTIDSIDWNRPTAIVLGNEKDGVSPEMLKSVDGCFRIPMLGFSQSFNISVAAALIFYHAHLATRGLGERALLSEEQRQQVLANYYLRGFDNPEALLREGLKRGI